MTKLKWDAADRYSLEGISNVALYPQVGSPFAWNGVIRFEDGVPIEPNVGYQDGLVYLEATRASECTGAITSYNIPDVLWQPTTVMGLYVPYFDSRSFGLAFLEGTEDASRLHMLWNVVFTNTGESYRTLGGDVEPTEYTINFRSRPIPGDKTWGFSHLVIEYTESYRTRWELEKVLFGTDSTDPRWPTIDEIIEIVNGNPNLLVVDNGDGTFTASSDYPGQIVVNEDGYFEISAYTAKYLTSYLYELSDSE